MNEYEEVLTELRQQEEEIQFASFTNDTALTVGMALLQEARKRGKPCNHRYHSQRPAALSLCDGGDLHRQWGMDQAQK